MKTKNFYIDIDKNRFISEQGGILTEWPTIAYGACPEWQLNFVRPDTLGNLQPIDVSDATAWHAAVDIDFDKSSTPMIRTLDEGIDHSEAVSGILHLSLNANTTSFEQKIGTRNSLPAFFEIRGYDSDGYVIYDYRMNVYALGAVDPNGSEPIEIPSGYATEDWTYAVLRAAPEYRFSEDGESDWHSTRTADDNYYQTRYPEGQWSESILIVNGQSITPELSGYATKEYVDTALSTKADESDIPTKTSDLTNDSGFITENALSGKQDKITSESKLDYALLSGTPTIPTVNNATLTITQGGTTKGTFTANASENVTINLDAGGGGGDANALTGVTLNGEAAVITDKVAALELDTSVYATYTDLEEAVAEKQDTITSESKLDYSLLSGTPAIPIVNNATLTITQGGTTKGTFTANASGDVTINLDAGGSTGNYIKVVNNTSSVTSSQVAYLWENSDPKRGHIFKEFKYTTGKVIPAHILLSADAGIDVLPQGYHWSDEEIMYCDGKWEADFNPIDSSTTVDGVTYPIYFSNKWTFTPDYDGGEPTIIGPSGAVPEGQPIVMLQDTYLYAMKRDTGEDVFYAWNCSESLAGCVSPWQPRYEYDEFPPGTIFTYGSSMPDLTTSPSFENTGNWIGNYNGPGSAAVMYLDSHYYPPSSTQVIWDFGVIDVTWLTKMEEVRTLSSMVGSSHLIAWFDGFYSLSMDSSDKTVLLPNGEDDECGSFAGMKREVTIEVDYGEYPSSVLTLSGNLGDASVRMLGTAPTITSGTIVDYKCTYTPKAGWYCTHEVVKP